MVKSVVCTVPGINCPELLKILLVAAVAIRLNMVLCNMSLNCCNALWLPLNPELAEVDPGSFKSFWEFASFNSTAPLFGLPPKNDGLMGLYINGPALAIGT